MAENLMRKVNTETQTFRYLYWFFVMIVAIGAGISLQLALGNSLLALLISPIVVAAFLYVESLLFRKAYKIYDGGRQAASVMGLTIAILIIWTVSFGLNVHGWYYKISIKATRLSELHEVDKQLELAKNVSNTAIDQLLYKLDAGIEDNIKNFATEINNYADKGHGKRAENYLIEIERLLGGKTINRLPKPRNTSERESYVRDMNRNIRDLKENRKEELKNSFQSVQNFLNSSEHGTVTQKVKNAISCYSDGNCLGNLSAWGAVRSFLSNEEDVYVNKILRDSYAYYSKCYDFVESNLHLTDFKLTQLPSPPKSIELTDSPLVVWRYWFKDGYFITAFLAALGLEVLVLFTYYYAYVKEDDIYS